MWIFGGVGLAYADDHGNNTSTATSISVNASRSGNIERGGDIDYFRITLDRAGALNIYTTSSMDTYGYLYNSLGSQVAANDDSYDGRNFRIQYNVLAAGTYYIAVKHYNTSGTGAYVLQPGFTPVTTPPPSTDDHGNNTSTATSISVNASRSGNIERGGDIDYFRITLDRAGALNIYTTSSMDTYGYLYNSLGSQVAANDDSYDGRNFRIQYTVPAAGTYYIAVKHYNTSGTGAYVLQPGFTPITPPPPDDDHGNNTSTATSISVNASRSGSIERGGDIDYFRITLTSAGALNIYTTSSMDTYGHLYNSAGSQVAANDDSYDGRNFRIQYNVLAAGTYYIAVRHYNSSGTGSYAVRADFVVANPPAAPTLITPSNGATNVAPSNVVFRWNAVTGATNYRIVISQNSGFTGFVDTGSDTSYCGDSGTCWTNTERLTATNIAKTLSLSGHTYYWRVRASGVGGVSSWSQGSFTTAGATSFPSSQAVDTFVTNKNGRCTDMDGAYGCQCVDLAHSYIQDVLGIPRTSHNLRGHAYPLYQALGTSATISYGTRRVRLDKIANSATNFPQKGDIIFWNTNVGGGVGHVAIVTSANVNSFTSLDQNWFNASQTRGSNAAIVNHNYNNVVGWWRPTLVSY